MRRKKSDLPITIQLAMERLVRYLGVSDKKSVVIYEDGDHSIVNHADNIRITPLEAAGSRQADGTSPPEQHPATAVHSSPSPRDRWMVTLEWTEASCKSIKVFHTETEATAWADEYISNHESPISSDKCTVRIAQIAQEVEFNWE